MASPKSQPALACPTYQRLAVEATFFGELLGSRRR
jgi:hypothetical protein